MTRISRTDLYLQMAQLVAKRGTCARRKVGCVLTDASGHIISTGYNGKPVGFPHCDSGDSVCSSASATSWASLDSCEAIHAEQNALLQCSDVSQIYSAYCTAQPCIHCMKLLLNTGCQVIHYIEPYPHDLAAEMWAKAGRSLISHREHLSPRVLEEAVIPKMNLTDEEFIRLHGGKELSPLETESLRRLETAVDELWRVKDGRKD